MFEPRDRGARRGGLAGRRGLGGRLGAPYLVPLAVALVAAGLLWAFWDRLAGVDLSVAVASPETQVREALAHQDRAHLSDVYGFKSGGTVELFTVGYGDVAVAIDGDRALVHAVVDGDGRVTWREEQASLSYVGRESFSMSRCDIALWCGDGRQFDRLRGVLTTLFRRWDAAATRDAEAYARVVSEGYEGAGGKAAVVARLRRELLASPEAHARVLGWQIRVERDRAVAGEDLEVAVPGGGSERRRGRYDLVLEDGRWRIAGGL